MANCCGWIKLGAERRFGQRIAMHVRQFVFSGFIVIPVVAVSLMLAAAKEAGSHVAFNEEGIAVVDGKPFFPIMGWLDEPRQDDHRKQLWVRYAEANGQLQADSEALAAH